MLQAHIHGRTLQVLGLSILCVPLALGALAASPAAQQDGGKPKQEARDAKAGGNLDSRLKRLNQDMRHEVTSLINDAARRHDLTIREEGLIISSLGPSTMVAGAPVQGVHDRVKAGANKGEGKDKGDVKGEKPAQDPQMRIAQEPVPPPSGGAQEPEPKDKEKAKRDKAGKMADNVLGLIVVSGGHGKAVEGGANVGKAPGGINTGAYAVVGEAGNQMDRVQLVGEDGKAYATIKVKQGLEPRKMQEAWWDAVYMSILAEMLPMAD
ncbi:MAG: hypothetical protein EYC70_15200 [Planctomycetota bacterium]|nr:MAG: hypothetical protein EYC70_15200 [Planctomycetota bacterium]